MQIAKIHSPQNVSLLLKTDASQNQVITLYFK